MRLNQCGSCFLTLSLSCSSQWLAGAGAEGVGVAGAGAGAAGDPGDERHSDELLCRRLTVCTGFSFVLFLMQGMCEFHVILFGFSYFVY